MSVALAITLILATWVLALLLAPLAGRSDSFWPLPLVLCVGCSGSIIALLTVH